MNHFKLDTGQVMKSFLITCFLLLTVAPVAAQASAQSVDSGQITPAELLTVIGGVVAAIVGGVVLIIKSYIDNRFDEEKSKRQEETDRLQQIARLTDAIVTLGQGMSASSATATNERAASAEERKEFRIVLDDNTKELKQHAEELARLRELVNSLVTDTKTVKDLTETIQARIGGSKNDPPLTELLSEATEAAKQAAETIKRVEANAAKIAAAAPPDDASSSKLPGIVG